jgi:gamma-glutamylputrescine oxidase
MQTSHFANRPRWDDHEWAPLPALRGDAAAELCVVGLGGTGLSCISEALDLGVSSVIGIDAADVAAGAAGRNGGLLLAGPVDFHHDAVARFGAERTLAMHRRTELEMQRIIAETPEVVRVVGSLRIASSGEEQEDINAQYARMKLDGLPVERYEGHEGRGLLFPHDGVMQPLRRTRNLATQLQSRGAKLFGQTAAQEVSSGTARTAHGTISAKHIVVCVDGKLEVLLPQLKPSVRTARLQMLAAAPQLPITFPRPVSTRYGFDYWQQLPDGSVLFGGGRDKFESHEWTTAAEPDSLVQDYLTAQLRTRLGIATEVTHRWAASVSFTETGLPLIQQIGDNVLALGAYSGTGNLVGAVCGRGAARAALKRDNSLLALFQD